MSAEMEWFPPDVKPARPGVYEVDADARPWFRYFDGEHWYMGDFTPKSACREFLSWAQRSTKQDPWRGLACAA